MERPVNWNVIVDELGTSEVRSFALGNLSGRQFYESAMCTFGESSPQVRNLLRNYGVNKARQIARKALKRRGVSV